jgi:hypothetical protein
MATLAIAAAAVAAPVASAQSEVNIDFSTAPKAPEPFPSDFFASQGIVFTASTGFIGEVQGNPALGGSPTIAADFSTPITGLSVDVAPGFQGTFEYTLTAFSQTGDVVATTSVIVTQDEGDPANQGFGYITIDLGRLARPAASFTLQGRFIRSSFGTPTCEGGGTDCVSTPWMRAISYTTGPTTKEQCKNGGWKAFGIFKNQGDCLSFVATGGKNPPGR